ncbi:glutaredoxin domain-containing protein [Streptomyces sp. NPDC059385]|uniref:glutaredoxin domain-containing protein n=1 Tax=Streptomyces sp. NPDC059385 TaxID=3346817 RepID=UPI0036770895
MSAINKINENAIVLFMKGAPNAPADTSSSKAAQAVMGCGEKFAYVDVVKEPGEAPGLAEHGGFSEIPQLWVAGELVGGADILAEMSANGELQALIKSAADKAEAAKA